MEQVLIDPHKVFVPCPRCTRPYKRTDKYPEEVCPVCEQQGPREVTDED